MHHHRPSTHRKSKVIMGVLVGVLLCYWFMFSYFVSSDDVDVPAPDPSRTEDISIPTKRTPLGGTKERTSDSDVPQKRSGPSGAISVEFSLAQIERSEEERERKCIKELCHQQCDPLCDQLPQKVKECSQPPCEPGEDWLIYEAELEYPLFHVDMPKFADNDDRQFFLKARPIATDYANKHSSCPSPVSRNPEPRCALVEPFDPKEKLIFSARAFMRGHIAVIENGVYSGRPDDTFDESRKCAYSSDYHWIAPSPPKPHGSAETPKAQYKKLLVLMMSVTGGAYFQHFVDRGLTILTQAWPLIESDPSIKLLVSQTFNSHKIVPQLYERLGLADRLVYSTRSQVTAEQMYFTCVSPHYHPYTYQKARDILGIDKFYPLENRKTIVYLSRKDVSRRVLNEDEVLKAIEQYLEKLDAGYKLEVFNHKNYKHANDTIEYFNKHARALIGPHGGAHYNQLFCASKTLIIEFFPFGPRGDNAFGAVRWPEAVWWPAAFMGHNYYLMPAVGETGDIKIDTTKLVSILQKELR